MFKKKILVVDDSNFFAEIIDNVLSQDGYDVIRSTCGEDCFQLVREEKPDLVLLDVIMPDISGLEVCRTLRASESNNLMPIIMLTGQKDHEDMINGLDAGADDYISKPFDKRELLCRVKNTLKRIDRNRNANPLTGLPGNHVIQRELDSRIEKNQPFAAIYIDIDNFKAYNDVYGFLKGDIAIKITADIACDVAAEEYTSDTLVGHIGGDDFIVLVIPEHTEKICNAIIEQFDTRIRSLYSQEDLDRGYIETYNRQGIKEIFPIMSISLGVVTNEIRTFALHLEVAEVAAELKKKAKSIEGSCYVKDRRKS